MQCFAPNGTVADREKSLTNIGARRGESGGLDTARFPGTRPSTLARSDTYDASGNAIADGTGSIGYDGVGRLTSASKSGASISYAHNALGQRVRKTVNGVTTIFSYDESGRLLGEYQASGALIREYVWLGDIPIAVITGGPGTPLHAHL